MQPFHGRWHGSVVDVKTVDFPCQAEELEMCLWKGHWCCQHWEGFSPDTSSPDRLWYFFLFCNCPTPLELDFLFDKTDPEASTQSFLVWEENEGTRPPRDSWGPHSQNSWLYFCHFTWAFIFQVLSNSFPKSCISLSSLHSLAPSQTSFERCEYHQSYIT